MKRLICTCLMLLFIFTSTLTAKASIGLHETDLCNSETSIYTNDYTYEEILSIFSDCMMTNKSYKLKIPNSLNETFNFDNLLKDVLNYENTQTYNLNNIVDVSYLSLSTNCIIYSDNMVEQTKYVSTINTTYNNNVTFDYEDYYHSIIENINIKGLSDYEKVYYIHKYICDSFDYSYDSKKTVSLSDNALNDRGLICGNYSVITKDLLNRAGIECVIIMGFSSNGVAHAWNLVELDDTWYWLDTTWDDCLDNLDNFLKGSDDFLKTHVIAKSYLKSLESYQISRTDYNEKKLLKPVLTGVCISDKKILHVDYKLNSAKNCKLYIDGKRVKNNRKVVFKNGSELDIKFDDINRSVFRYKIFKINGKYCVVRYE